MKLIGIGLELPPVKMVTFISALDSPRMSIVQRWWFTPDYDCVKVSQDRLAMELVGQGVKLQNQDMSAGPDGRLQNAGFLDYRIPVASDLPMIDTVIVEVPNPGHPYGVRGVGETSIVPPLAAIANAVSRAAGVRMTELPMSPPRLLAALDAQREKLAAE